MADDIEAMRKKVMDADAAAALAREAEQAEAMKPLNDFAKSTSLADVKQQVEDLAVTYASDVQTSQKINAVRMALSLF